MLKVTCSPTSQEWVPADHSDPGKRIRLYMIDDFALLIYTYICTHIYIYIIYVTEQTSMILTYKGQWLDQG